jgi:hypothetical protein
LPGAGGIRGCKVVAKGPLLGSFQIVEIRLEHHMEKEPEWQRKEYWDRQR